MKDPLPSAVHLTAGAGAGCARVVLLTAVCVATLAAGCGKPHRLFQPSRDPDTLSDMTFLHYLATLPVVTVDEGTRAVLLLKAPTSHWPTFEDRTAELKRFGAFKDAWGLEQNQVLDKGTFFYMLSAVCGLPKSFNELLATPTGLGGRRYALKKCIHAGLLPYGLADEFLTGGEMVSALTKAESYVPEYGSP